MGPAIERLERLVRGSVAGARRPAALRHAAAAGAGATPAPSGGAARRPRQFDQIVADLVAEAEQDGDIRPDVDPAVTARLLFGMVNSLVEWYRPGRGATPVEDLADAVCAVAFDGLRIRREPSG